MRPVNLIPQDERRGERAQTKTGPLPYVVVGGLVAVLAGVFLMVTTGNDIEERRAEIDQLEAREQAAVAYADQLRPYADFAALALAREQTVNQLATSRFDWERVLNELALVIPSDVWLVSLKGTVGPEVQLDGGVSVSSRSTIPGPALEIAGCAVSQDAVAGFVSALRDIDGVTRVGLQSSKLPEVSAEGPGAGGGGGGGGDAADCQTRDFIAGFQVVAAFDAAPVAAGAVAPDAALPPATSAEPADASGVAETQGAQQQAQESAGTQTDQAANAANLVPGVSR